MTIKEQFVKIKENWLLILLPLLLVILFFGMGGIGTMVQNFSTGGYESAPSRYASESSRYAPAQRSSMAAESMPPPRDASYKGGFTPEAKDRLISKTARQSTEVEKGHFGEAESTIKSIIKSSDAYLLNEDVDTYDAGTASEYKRASYEIKVEATKYDVLVQQLKGIGKLLSFNEIAEDITKTYTDLKVELENERTRLQRYEQMYAEAKKMEDKIDLSDRMFEQERRIKYLEESVDKLGKQAVYSTIQVTIREKKSPYADVKLVELSAFVGTLVGSLNALLVIAVALLPWVLAVMLIVLVVRKLRGQQNKNRGR